MRPQICSCFRPLGLGSVQILNLPREIYDHDSEAYLTGVFPPALCVNESETLTP